jgi:hypothetical protein
MLFLLALLWSHGFSAQFVGDPRDSPHLSEIWQVTEAGSVMNSTGGLLFIFMAGRSFGNFSGSASGQPSFIAYAGLQVQVTRRPRKKRPNPPPGIPHL